MLVKFVFNCDFLMLVSRQ